MGLLVVLLSAATVLSALVVELWLFAPRREPSSREALVWSIGWLSLAVAVVGIAVSGGGAGEWTTVYVIEIGDLASLVVVAVLLVGGVVASLLADRMDPPTPHEEATRRPPRCPQHLGLHRSLQRPR